MAKSKPRKDPPPDNQPSEEKGVGRPSTGSKQVNVRLPSDLLADLDLIGEELSLDLSNVIRMILSQQRHQYVDQVRAARTKRQRQAEGN